MDGIIFKYDLVSKELLFRWKTDSEQQIILFDRDDKLITVDKHEIRMWDFDDSQERPPCLWGIESFYDNEVKKVFINEGSKQPKTGEKPTWFILVVLDKELRVYKNNMCQTLGIHKITKDRTVESACFDYNNTMVFVGWSDGTISFIDLKIYGLDDGKQDLLEIEGN